MNVLIVEDEHYLIDQLIKMLRDFSPAYLVKSHTGSVKKTIEILQHDQDFDLIFLDIYLSDGLSFEIFKEVNVDIPIIFTTAYDQHAIQAFEVNSVDYLLKPILESALHKSLRKFERLAKKLPSRNQQKLLHLTEELIAEKKYKKNFLLPYKDRLVPLRVDDFRYFKVSNGVVKGITEDNKLFILDDSLDELAEKLNPHTFYRANRQFLVNRDAIRDIEYYFNGRLSINLQPQSQEQVLISKAKATHFKDWMNDVV